MNRNSNTYTFVYAILMVVVVATVLSVIAMVLQPKQKLNIEIEKKRNILSAINIESTAKNANQLFDKYITQLYAIDVNGNKLNDVDAFNLEMKLELRKPQNEMALPIYIANLDDNSTKYIFPLYGKGLWGPIWGFIALNDDLNTVYGANFAHQSETPGLGAEIDTKNYQIKFENKMIFDANDNFVSIDIVKGDIVNEKHAVDAISGGTITSYGLRDMIKNCLSLYLNYIEQNK